MKSHVWCSSLTQDLEGIRRNNRVPHSNQRQQLFASHSSLLQDGIISRFIKNGMNAERTDTLPADQTHNCILPPASPLQPVLRPGYQRMQKGSISQSLPFPSQHSDSKTLLLDCSRDTQHQLPSHLFSLCQMCSTPAAFAKLCADLPHSPPAHSAPSPMPHTLPALGGLSIPSLMFICSRCCSDDSWTKTLHHPIILAHLPAPFQRQHQNLY